MIILRWSLSLLFIIQMYVMMLVMAVVGAPWAIWSRQNAIQVCHIYTRWVIFTARILCGIRTEIRGPVPTGEVIIAAKHQSFFDILVIFNALKKPKFVMKRELIYTPLLGQYALRIGCIPVDRSKGSKALKQMSATLAQDRANAGQLVIYPQGTRVIPGEYTTYKPGTALLAHQLKQPCVPVATNIGLFWPKHGIMRKPGVAVVEFLPAIEPGLAMSKFMLQLENDIETASDALMAEAGFIAPPRPTTA